MKNLPTTGTTHPIKKVGGTKYYVWDLVDACRLDKCEAYDVCEFVHNQQMTKEDGTPKKCRIMYWWLKGAADTYFHDANNMDRYTLWRIGMRLMPMQRVLCKLHIMDAGLPSYMYTNNRGNITCVTLPKHISELQMKIDQLERNIFGKSMDKDPEIPFEIPRFAPGKKKV